MTTIDLLFCTNSRNPLSWVIRAGSWSRWSHVALIDGNSVIEAVALKGVVRTPLSERKRQDPSWQIVSLPCLNPSAVLAAAASQIGKPYDYTGVLGIGLHRDWQAEDRWCCSELVAWSFSKAGEPLFRAESVHRVTPEHFWMLAPAAVPA